MRALRFGFQSTATDPAEAVRSAQVAEDAGFDVFQLGDHVGPIPAVIATLAAVAMRTTRIRLCPLVLNNDLRHPVVLAQELATLDHLSGGRLEVGMGAGHSFTEYEAIGQSFDPPAIRKVRLAESVEILGKLFTGEPVTYAGEHYTLAGAATLRPLQDHIPILVGVNGRQALAHAARHADIVAPTMLGKTLPDGQHHEVRWEAARLDDTVTWIRQHAAERWDDLELHALVQSVVVTDDSEGAGRAIAEHTGMTLEDILASPFLCIGTHEEIVEHLLACRERWGITYYTVRDVETIAPMLEALRA